MNLFAFTSLAVSICSLILAIFVFSIAKTKLHKIWALFNLSVFTWAIDLFFAAIATSAPQATLSWKWAYSLGAIVPYMFYRFIYEFTELNKTKTLNLIFILGILFIPINLLSPYFINKVNYLFNSFYYNEATLLYSVFILYLISVVILSFIELLNYYKRLHGNKKTQTLILLYGFGVGWSGGFVTFLPAYNILIYPAWNFVVCIYALLMTYAIFKHNFIETQIIIKKGIVYSLLATLLTICYLILIFIFEKVLRDSYGYQSFHLTIFIALSLGVIFSPIKDTIQQLVDRHLFNGTPEELSEQNQLLRQEVTDKEKFKAVANLASNIVHELKNPLTALKTFHEYLPAKKDDPEFMAKFQSIGAHELERLEKLSRELLDFAKPSPLNLVDADINQLINETVDLMRSQAAKSNIEIITQFHTILPLIKIDKNQIKQVLINLISNSIEAMPNGGTLILKTENANTKIYIYVEDTGCGIAAEDIKHIFDPFFTKKSSGTGLGLAICYQIITEHKGKFTVESSLGKGTIFKITLQN